MFNRDTAYKVWIYQLVNGLFTSTVNAADGSIRSQIQVDNLSVSRVNIIATVTELYLDNERQFASITLDDGSAAMRAKSFKENLKIIDGISKGDLVIVIGKIREYQNDIYILPEIIKKLPDLTWALVRKMELTKIHKKTEVQQVRIQQVPQVTITNPKFKVLHLIHEHEVEAGVPIQSIIQTGTYPLDQMRKLIEELISDGEIYENKPNHYKII